MRKAIIASTFIVAGYVLGVASCGGATTTPGTDGGGGATGSGSKGTAGHGGAKGSGGSKGSGGTAGTGTKGSGGTAGSGTGGTTGAGGSMGAGGTAGTTGGTGGSAGTGGDAGPGPGCSPTEPKNGSTCTPSTAGFTQCTYGSDVCDCFGGMGMGATWNCTTCPVCPTAQPTGTCTGGGFACGALPPCTYGTTSCTCAGGMGMGGGGMWSCGTCPGTQPADMSMCPTDGLSCDYGATTCDCRGFMGGGTTAWRCFTPPPACPMTEPAPGSTCTAGTGGFMGCTYGAASCQCVPVGMGNQWSCT